MRYKIKDIPPDGLAFDLALPRALLRDALDGLSPDLDHCSGSARGTLTVNRQEVFASGGLKAMVTVPCARCLEPASVLVAAPLRMLFTVSDEGGADEPDDDNLDDADVGHYDGEVIDLEPTLRELLILGMPMTPRCQDGCKGLCPTCGANRNTTECGHAEAVFDPRLAALKSLKLD